MLPGYQEHNLFRENINKFSEFDPHLRALKKLKYVSKLDWWRAMSLETPGIYMLTGGRQIGKTTSCKLLIKHCLQDKLFLPETLLYMPCDEIFSAQSLRQHIQLFLDEVGDAPFLLIIDEITYVQDWDRVIKAFADAGYFQQGLCLLTGSDTVILKEAAMRFPGRRGSAQQVDFHLYPLTFAEYVALHEKNTVTDRQVLSHYFNDYLQTGGFLRAINDLAMHQSISEATRLIFEQWIRGDFLKRGKHEDILQNILQGLLTIGVSQISYSALTQKIGNVSKETTLDYCRLLNRMDVFFDLQAFDQNKKQGFPRKDRKLHLSDPFIYDTIALWLKREGLLSQAIENSVKVEACVASHCRRYGKAFYFKGQGEIDIICLKENNITAIEVEWANQIRKNDLKMLQHFDNAILLTKRAASGEKDSIKTLPVYCFLYEIEHYIAE